MNEKGKKKTLILVVVAICLLAVVISAYILLGPKGVNESKSIVVNVDHLTGEDTSHTINTDEKYLRGALESKKLIKGEESQYGLYVLSVDGETADESKEQWWGFNVNGEFAQNGVDDQPISDGDVYDFKLNEGY